MRAPWSALHSSFTSALNRTSAETAFTAMRQTYPKLAQVPTIAAVMEHQHLAATDAAMRFGVIRTLVAASQSDHGFRSTAQIMVIVALWPGLDAVYWRLWRGFPGAREELQGEIISRISDAILTIDLDRVTAVTATLLRNLERDIRRDQIRDRLLAEDARHIDDPVVEAQATLQAWWSSFEAGSIDDHLADLVPRDALLLRRIILIGETQEEAGRALGLGPSAARKRIQRALQKLRSTQKYLLALSHSDPPIGL